MCSLMLFVDHLPDISNAECLTRVFGNEMLDNRSGIRCLDVVTGLVLQYAFAAHRPQGPGDKLGDTADPLCNSVGCLERLATAANALRRGDGRTHWRRRPCWREELLAAAFHVGGLDVWRGGAVSGQVTDCGKRPLDEAKQPSRIVLVPAIAQLESIEPSKLLKLCGQLLLPGRLSAINQHRDDPDTALKCRLHFEAHEIIWIIETPVPSLINERCPLTPNQGH